MTEIVMMGNILKNKSKFTTDSYYHYDSIFSTLYSSYFSEIFSDCKNWGGGDTNGLVIPVLLIKP